MYFQQSQTFLALQQKKTFKQHQASRLTLSKPFQQFRNYCNGLVSYQLGKLASRKQLPTS